MCFRPSALTMDDSNIQKGTCPSCGMPVAAGEGVTAGTCPHCGKPIPIEVDNGPAGADLSGQSKRIL
ncbi:MAG: hypothetical protein IJ111_05165 [Eggerthellaceae bacterium]|nr:hypothetical protein [Eggerthellaceae bacterium]